MGEIEIDGEGTKLLYYIDEGDSSYPENDCNKYGLIGGKIANYKNDEQKLEYWSGLLDDGCWCRVCHKLASSLKREGLFCDDVNNAIISVPSLRIPIKEQLEHAFRNEFSKVHKFFNFLSKIKNVSRRNSSIDDIKNNIQFNSSYNKNTFRKINRILIIDDYYSSGDTMRAVYKKIKNLLPAGIDVLFAVPGRSYDRCRIRRVMGC